MSIIPNRNNTTIIQGATGFNLDNVETNEVPYKSEDGTLQGSGLMMLSSGALLAPVGFSVESGSVDFGDVLRLSESATFLAIQDMIDNSHYQIVDYYVPRSGPSSKPYLFMLGEAEHTFQSTSGTDILTGPVSFEYTTQLTARTNALVFSASGPMTNVRLRIRDKTSNVALKYFPSKSSWVTGSLGATLSTGDNILDFQDTALILTAGDTLIFDIIADSYAFYGTASSGIAKFAAIVQEGTFVGLTTSTELNAVKATIPASSVTSVNGMTGVVIVPEPAAQVNSDWNSTTGLSQILNKPTLFDGQYTSLTGVPTSFNPSAHTHVISDVTGLQTALNSKFDSTSVIPYSQLSGTPTIPAAQVNSDWNATSGLAMILNKPIIPVVNYPVVSVNSKIGTVVLSASDVGAIATGALIPYSTITGTPVLVTKTSQLTNDSGYLTSVTYPVLSVNGKTGSVVLTYTDVGAAATNHTHVISDVTGLQSALDSKITTGTSIPYSTLTGTPTIPAAQVNSDWNSTSGVSQILNKPVLATVAISGSYNDLSNKPTIPSIPVTSVNTKTGAVVLTYTDVGAAATVHTHVISDTAGLQAALDSKVATGGSIPYSVITGTPTIPVNNSFTFKGLSDTDDTAIANGYLVWNTGATSVSYSTTIPFSVLSGKPTTLSGYGITDGVTATSLSTTLTSYTTTSALNTMLSSYTTTSALNTMLSGYATTSALTSGLAAKFNIPAGTTAQYVRGDGSLATLPIIPTVVSAFTNDSGYLTSITGTQVTTALGFTPYNATNPNAYVNQAGARSSISLTTTGIGAATYSSSTGIINVPTPTRTFAYPTRVVNTAYQISATQDSVVTYSVQMTVTATITSGQNGDIILEVASNSAFTTNVQTVAIAGLSQVYTLAVAIQGVQGQTTTIQGTIPAGYYARIRTVSTTGTPTFSIRAGQEVLI